MTRTKSSDPTPLGYAILGLVLERPRTGYAVRKVFEETAMGQYSSSPGSIYPALRRLENQGLIEKTSEESRSARPTTFFRATRKGRNRFRVWLRLPIVRRDITHGLQELMLRFAFMDHVPRSEAVTFLESMKKEILEYVRELEAFRDAEGDELPLMASLVFDNGIEGYRAHAKWAGEAAKKLRRNR